MLLFDGDKLIFIDKSPFDLVILVAFYIIGCGVCVISFTHRQFF